MSKGVVTLAVCVNVILLALIVLVPTNTETDLSVNDTVSSAGQYAELNKYVFLTSELVAYRTYTDEALLQLGVGGDPAAL